MKKLENWLVLWRLSNNPSKCQFIIFTKGEIIKMGDIKIKLFNSNVHKFHMIHKLYMINNHH